MSKLFLFWKRDKNPVNDEESSSGLPAPLKRASSLRRIFGKSEKKQRRASLLGNVVPSEPKPSLSPPPPPLSDTRPRPGQLDRTASGEGPGRDRSSAEDASVRGGAASTRQSPILAKRTPQHLLGSQNGGSDSPRVLKLQSSWGKEQGGRWAALAKGQEPPTPAPYSPDRRRTAHSPVPKSYGLTCETPHTTTLTVVVAYNARPKHISSPGHPAPHASLGGGTGTSIAASAPPLYTIAGGHSARLANEMDLSNASNPLALPSRGAYTGGGLRFTQSSEGPFQCQGSLKVAMGNTGASGVNFALTDDVRENFFLFSNKNNA